MGKTRTPPAGRDNQKRRTRQALLDAAGRLLRSGKSPDMDAVADAAMVSRATAYRYFPTVDALLLEVPLDQEMPDAAAVLAGSVPGDVVARIDRAEAALHEMCYRNSAQLRLMLAASLRRKADGATRDVPVRQNRRTPLIEQAIGADRKRLTPAAHDRLRAALALLFGPESMVVFDDVLGIDRRRARKIKQWAIRALTEAALAESERPSRR